MTATTMATNTERSNGHSTESADEIAARLDDQYGEFTADELDLINQTYTIWCELKAAGFRPDRAEVNSFNGGRTRWTRGAEAVVLEVHEHAPGYPGFAAVHPAEANGSAGIVTQHRFAFPGAAPQEVPDGAAVLNRHVFPSQRAHDGAQAIAGVDLTGPSFPILGNTIVGVQPGTIVWVVKCNSKRLGDWYERWPQRPGTNLSGEHVADGEWLGKSAGVSCWQVGQAVVIWNGIDRDTNKPRCIVRLVADASRSRLAFPGRRQR